MAASKNKKATTKKTTKKPTKKPTTKTTVKKQPAAKKSAKTESIFKVGDSVTFSGYDKEPEDGAIFQKGDLLTIVDIENDEDTGIPIYGCILASDISSFEDDAESVDGDSLIGSEIKSTTKSKKEIKAAEPKAAPVMDVKNIGSLGRVIKKHGNNPIEAADSLYENIQENFFYLGGCLAHIFKEKLYEETHMDWGDFCQERYGFKGRKGRYLIDVYQTYSKLDGFNVEQLKSLGWSKAAELGRYITADNKNELLKLANESNIVDLKAELKESYTSEGTTSSGRQATRESGSVKRVTYTFKLYEDQAEGVTLALEEAQKQLGVEDLNQAFEYIVMNWADEHISKTKAAKVKKSISKGDKQNTKAKAKN